MEENEYNPELCHYKHEEINKDFSEIKNNLKTFFDKEEKRNEDLRKYINGFMEEMREEVDKSIKKTNEALKNKIIVTGERIGVQIDALTDFNKTLKGNGKPSVNEKIRSLTKSVYILYIIILFTIILMVGGELRGRVSLEKIGDFLFGKSRVQQVEPPPPSFNYSHPIDENHSLFIDPNYGIRVVDVNDGG